ncbi:MAG: hypothetical protein ACI4SY_03075, partial [Sutterella sp.]
MTDTNTAEKPDKTPAGKSGAKPVRATLKRRSGARTAKPAGNAVPAEAGAKSAPAANVKAE